MDLASLRNADLAHLISAADAYDALHRAFAQHVEDWKKGTALPVRDLYWTGEAAQAAAPIIYATSKKLHGADLEMTAIGKNLRDHADLFALAQSKLRKALDDAAAKGFSVGDSGAVSWLPSANAYTAPGWEDKQRAAAEEINKRIVAALTEATEADRQLAELLTTYTKHADTGNGLGIAAEMDLAAANATGHEPWKKDLPGEKATPTEVNAWWRSLDPQGQEWFRKQHADVIRNLDGIPAQERDQLNRTYLNDRLVQLEREGRKETEEYRRLAAIQGRLKDNVENQATQPLAYLLGVSTEGNGRAVISFGNPDTATDVSAYVPGITSTPYSLGPKGEPYLPGTNEAENTLNLWREADRRKKPGGSVASIVWLGYDAPDADPTAASGNAAAKGAPDYARFLTGLRASHAGGTPPHITSIGHSYGSLVTGLATRLTVHDPSYAPPDDVVFVGSPGVGTPRASDLKMPGHVWVGAAADDPVTHLPSYNDLRNATDFGTAIAVAQHLVFDPDGTWYGTDPASKTFGATRFSVDDWSAATDPMYGAHTKYLTPENGGPSLGNIAAVVTGHGGDVQRVDRR
ncbi:alpha/beta hydrolase [Kitasatospora sp. NPDC051170]|uniref:alpha/beta hydrolase n=1 Tax=Kitasatospora sp. NPDC051170 TaxID=3364056 RepID=UPI0037BB9F17